MSNYIENQNFTTVLFRLANLRKDSIICVEVATVKNHCITENKYWLINPACEFDNENSAQREFLTAEDVENNPTFPEIWKNIKPYFENQILVTQNTAHIINMLRHTLVKHNLEWPDLEFYDSKDLARKTFGNFISYDPWMFAEFIDLNYQYGLGNFAKFIADLTIKILNKNNSQSLEELAEKFEVIPGKFKNNKYYPYHSHISFRSKTDLNEIEVNTNADIQHPLYGQNIVFTGKLNIERSKAAQLAAICGAKPQNNVNKHTNILVIGDFDARKYASDTKSNKMIRAEEILKDGGNIEVINGAEFLELVH